MKPPIDCLPGNGSPALFALSGSYLALAKPGIVAGNLVSVAAGLLLAFRGNVDWVLAAMVLAGVALLIASACAANNVVDRDIDAVMARTRLRPMVRGTIGVRAALSFAAALGVAGLGLLYAATRQWLPVLLMLIGYAAYVGLYTLCLKRTSVHGTLAGSISGAIPPVVGYCAVSAAMDATAWTLLLIFALWQMPHSYAIGIFRAADYRAAGIPVLPVIRGSAAAKRQIVIYMVAFIAAALLLAVTGKVGRVYVACALSSGLYWLRLGLRGFTASDDARWARQVFSASIMVVAVISVAMSVDFVLPH